MFQKLPHRVRSSAEKERMIVEIMKCYYRPELDEWKSATIEKTAKIYKKTLKGLSDWLND